MKKFIQWVYYLCFGWLILLVAAELGAIILKSAMCYNFLNEWFYSMLTWFAMAFVGVRFLYIVINDLKKRLQGKS